MKDVLIVLAFIMAAIAIVYWTRAEVDNIKTVQSYDDLVDRVDLMIKMQREELEKAGEGRK